MWKKFMYKNFLSIHIDAGIMVCRVAGEPGEELFINA